MLKEASGSPYIRHRCQIPVPDPRNHSQYTISVRPKKEEKFIKSSENSEFAPSLLRQGSCDSTASLCNLNKLGVLLHPVFMFITFNKKQSSE